VDLISDSLLVGLCARFLDGERADELADWLHEQDERLQVNRTRIYELLGEARRRGLIRLQVRDAGGLHGELMRAARLGADPRRSQIRVVGASGEGTTEQVAARSAEVALQLIRDLARSKRDGLVRIGLGGGRTMRMVSQQLAAMLRRELDRPPLAVHALSSGFDPRAPQNAPITFLGMFDGVARELVGLFSSGMLEPGQAGHTLELPGVGESFELAEEIDLVITSLASAHDPSGALNRFLAHREHAELEESRIYLERRGWVGDVLYKPYSSTEPIDMGGRVQAVSVLKLPDLLAMTRRENKRVLLVVAPSESGRSKADALVPLLTQPALALWTDLVIDAPTAENVVRILTASALRRSPGASGP
jgi:DNA-binding transcriptional regulator LsrR (DeoR family)